MSKSEFFYSEHFLLYLKKRRNFSFDIFIKLLYIQVLKYKLKPYTGRSVKQRGYSQKVKKSVPLSSQLYFIINEKKR